MSSSRSSEAAASPCSRSSTTSSTSPRSRPASSSSTSRRSTSRDCVEAALDLLAEQASTKGLELADLIDPRTPTAWIGDVTRVRQILINLVSNAVKFTETGEVVVSVASRLLASSAETTPEASPPIPTPPRLLRHELHISVRDTGIGIPADRMNRLFRSFSQVDVSTSRRYGGTGLGLVICKQLSELMGGRMWVESEPGKGSTFHFTILVEASSSPMRVSLHTTAAATLRQAAC